MTVLYLDGIKASTAVSVSATSGGITKSVQIDSYAVPPEVTGLPMIAGSVRQGKTVTCLTNGLTGITGHRWMVGGQPIAGATGPTLVVPMPMAGMNGLSCEVACDQGVLTSPPALIRMSMPEMADMEQMEDELDDLVRTEKMTHVTTKSGPWSDPATWHNGLLPSRNSRVLHQRGHDITYDLNPDDAPRIDYLRTDGVMTWDITKDTKLHVETAVSSPTGEWHIGSFSNRVPLGVKAEIISADRLYEQDDLQPTDLSIEDDPSLLGRGVMWEGIMSTWGHHRTRRVKPAVGSSLVAGATSVTLASDTEGWQIGDRLVIAGTYVSGFLNQSETEVVVLTAKSGRNIEWDTPLVYDHTHQRPDIDREDLQADIANLTCNVVFRSECGPTGPVYRRGHLMGMHKTSRTDMWDVAFVDLGRTVKGTEQKDTSGIIVDGIFTIPNKSKPGNYEHTTATARSNRQTRYSIHLHFVGMRSDNKGFVDTLDSCVAERTAGWGMVHHSCHANMTRNLIFDFGGAGMVSETGNETGLWTDNCAIKSRSRTRASLKNSEARGTLGDYFTMGSGFAMRGRAMVVNDNTTFDVMTGYHFFHRGDGGGTVSDPIYPKRVDLDMKDLQGPYLKDTMSFVDYPIIHWADNEAGGCRQGFGVTKASVSQGHGINIDLKRFKCWGYSSSGINIEYIAQYRVSDADVVAGKETTTGVWLGSNTYDIAIVNCRTTGGNTGIMINGGEIYAPNAEYDAVENPKFVVSGHEHVDDATAIAYAPDSLPITRIFPVGATERVPDVDLLPFILWDWDGGNQKENISNEKTGILRDSLSLLGKLPKPSDNLGMLVRTGVPQNINRHAVAAGVHARRYGYWQVNGENVVIFPLYFADRITAWPLKVFRAFRCTGNMSSYTNNGPYTLSTTPPTVAPASMSLAIDGTATLNILNLVTVEAGATKTLETSFFAPDHGEIVLSNDSITYTPNAIFRGVDSCYVWVSDGRGQAATVKVDILVGITAAQPIPDNLWTVTSKTNLGLTVKVSGRPDSGGRRIDSTEYSLDNGVTWKRLCYGWVPSSHYVGFEGASPTAMRLRYQHATGGSQGSNSRAV